MTWPRPPLDKNIILYLYIADASHIQPLLSRSETNNMRRVVVDSLYTWLLLSRIATFLNAPLMNAARYIYISLIAIANGIRLPHAEYWKSPPASSTCYAQRPVISILHLWWLDMFDFPSFFVVEGEGGRLYYARADPLKKHKPPPLLLLLQSMIGFAVFAWNCFSAPAVVGDSACKTDFIVN